MSKPRTLTQVSHDRKTQAKGIIALLMADHRLLRSLMKQVKAKRATDQAKTEAFSELLKAVASHVHAEEVTFFSLIRDHPRFEGRVMEGYEEHRVHENLVAGIRRVTDKARRIQQMGIYCEILEHHLDEEEEKLFPRFKRYVATPTRKKIGKNYLEDRQKTAPKSRRGAARFASAPKEAKAKKTRTKL